MNIESIVIGHTLLQRWEEGSKRGVSYLDEFGEVVTRHGDAWWVAFDVLREPRVRIFKRPFHMRGRWQETPRHQAIILMSEGENPKRAEVFGPQWTAFYKAVTTPRTGEVGLMVEGVPEVAPEIIDE